MRRLCLLCIRNVSDTFRDARTLSVVVHNTTQSLSEGVDRVVETVREEGVKLQYNLKYFPRCADDVCNKHGDFPDAATILMALCNKVKGLEFTIWL